MAYVSEVNKLAVDKDVDAMCKNIRKKLQLNEFEAPNVLMISTIMYETYKNKTINPKKVKRIKAKGMVMAS